MLLVSNPPPLPSVYISSNPQYQFHQLYHLFIPLLLTGDIDPNQGPPKCLKVTCTINTLPLQKLFLTTTLISLPCQRLGLDLTSQVQIYAKLPHQVTIFYQQPREVHHGGSMGFFVKNGLDPSVVPRKRPAPALKISSSKYPYTKNLFIF